MFQGYEKRNHSYDTTHISRGNRRSQQSQTETVANRSPNRIAEFHKKYTAKPEVSLRKIEWARAHKDEINNRRREQYRQVQRVKRDIETMEITEAPTEPVV